MSVYGMTQLSFAWHLYMRAYSPSVRAMSFVDDLSLLSSAPGFLATGLACIIEFFQLWNMAIDASKSYCWALGEGQRKQLIIRPFQRVEHAHELGGVLVFQSCPTTTEAGCSSTYLLVGRSPWYQWILHG